MENQQIIADALKELNYKENKVARILANGKIEFVGIIIPDLYHHYYSEMLSRILSTYETFGYKFLVFVGDKSEETERRYIQELLSYKIEGMIILNHTIPSEELARHHYDILIHINSPTPENVPAYGRLKGFSDFCREFHLKHEVILKDFGHSYKVAQSQLVTVLEHIDAAYSGQKKGIFVSNDTHANALLNLLVRRFGHLPDDYLIVGFDNSPISREAILPIGTVGQQIDKLAYEATALLVEQMNERKKRNPFPWSIRFTRS